MKEKNKYEIIKKLVETNGNKDRAAIKLGCTKRTVDRMIAGYKKSGKKYFVHGNRGRKPAITLDPKKRKLVFDLYLLKYYDANFEHFCELLGREEKIYVSPNTVRSILMEHDIISPLATRSTRRALKKKLENELDVTKGNQRKNELKREIMEIEDPHPRRPRSAYFGELLQMDASEYVWFGSLVTHLHASIDDALGTLTGAFLAEQEILDGYYHVLAQTLLSYGIPYGLLTDRRTVFEYKRLKDKRIEKDSFTQFSYACSQLGIEINTTSVPQAKGRIERLFNTLQSRLPVEMRLAGVTSIEEANEFLKSYIKVFNDRFALKNDTIKSVFEKQPDPDTVNLTLAVLAKRKIDSGHSIRFEKKYYITHNPNNKPCFFPKGTEVTVIKALDGRLFASVNDKVYALSEVPKRRQTSPAFDSGVVVNKKIKQLYVPPMSHPWRTSNIDTYFTKTNKDYAQSFIDAAYSNAPINL
jgi:transposase